MNPTKSFPFTLNMFNFGNNELFPREISSASGVASTAPSIAVKTLDLSELMKNPHFTSLYKRMSISVEMQQSLWEENLCLNAMVKSLEAQVPTPYNFL